MWQFIVSGYIPGTEVQLSFDIIAMFFLATSITYLAFRFVRNEKQLRDLVTDLIHSKTV